MAIASQRRECRIRSSVSSLGSLHSTGKESPISERHRPLFLSVLALLVLLPGWLGGHGTVVSPMSRVYRVYQANPDNPAFPLAAQAVAIDGTLSYYTWNELSRNIPQAVLAGLPPGFDYSPWVPDGQLASGGRVDPASPEYSRTYAGLDQVSVDWPTTPVAAGDTIEVDFLATAPHDPSVWDVWMTTPDWTPDLPLNWGQLEFLGRPTVTLAGGHYTFDLTIPSDRGGHHVVWIAWHRNDPVGEVFFSTSDVWVTGGPPPIEFVRADANGDGALDLADAVQVLSSLFSGAPTNCAKALDANDDGAVDIADPIRILANLFSSAPAPPLPFPGCGVDPTLDGLACSGSLACP
ncbi:MAG: lytic polysaccharide monooxygenase [Planctomycetota bacterium]